ncbi:MAG: hypothetical protein M1812_004234 [Candelaria pacifica]|nr:MAG: hypothetical protein M1812_004234 [Candelaria pacifica]
MRWAAGALSIFSASYIHGVVAESCGIQGSFGRPSKHICDTILELGFPLPDDAWRIFSTDTTPAQSEGGYSFEFPNVLTPVKHQRVVGSLGCAIAVYNTKANPGDGPKFSVNSWSVVLDAIENVLDACLPYGGSQNITGDLTGGLTVHVYEPGAAIEDYLSANSMEEETTDDQSFLAHWAEEAIADELESSGAANEASRQEAQTVSPQATYCQGRTTKFPCVRHVLKTSVLLGNTLTSFTIVSTYA